MFFNSLFAFTCGFRIFYVNVRSHTKGDKMGRLQNPKQQIMDTALNLFSLHGYVGTSIRHIAREVGVRESAIYNHFKSKEELLFKIVDQSKSSSAGTNLLTDDLIDIIDKPDRFIKEFCERLVRQWDEDFERKLILLLLHENGRDLGGVGISLKENLNDSRAVWKMIFTQMIKHKFIKKNDPDLLADQFIAPLYFIRLEHMTGDKTIKTKQILELVNRHVDFFYAIIKK